MGKDKAPTKPQQRKKKGDRFTGGRDKIKFIDLKFERGQVVAFGKGGRQDVSIQEV